jgi:hypothetical protein
MAHLLLYVHPHVFRYAQADVPDGQTIIRRNRVELCVAVSPEQFLLEVLPSLIYIRLKYGAFS